MTTTIPRPSRTARGTACFERGAGSPIVFIHGVGMNAEAWEPQMDFFAADHRVIALDMPGHGETPPLPGTPGLDDYVAWAAAAIEDLGAAPCDLVGHSMGGLIVTGLALARPDLVSRVAALNAVYDREDAARAAVQARAAEIVASGDAGDVEAPLRRWFGATAEPRHRALVERVRGWLAAVPPAGYATAYQVFAISDRAHVGRLPGLACPALFLTGELDPNSTPAMSEAMADAAPFGRAVIMAGERHMLNLTAPAETNRILAEHFARPLQAIRQPAGR
ncbi:alpha/beta fold hydrolase [Zavarzinia sp.]|uniref:alpha/beta fold hydrolase n=1 Tax=Zavarzinia sp. TaxID=2027920 RepID=UPI0035669890